MPQKQPIYILSEFRKHGLRFYAFHYRPRIVAFMESSSEREMAKISDLKNQRLMIMGQMVYAYQIVAKIYMWELLAGV